MKKLEVVVVDDEVKSAKLLVHFITTHCPTLQVAGIAHSLNDGIRLINQLRPKVIFLDIVLDNSTSFDILDSLSYSEYRIVFVTAYDQFALKAFNYNTLDYILKPISIDSIKSVADKIHQEIINENFTLSNQIAQLTSLIKTYDNRKDFVKISTMNTIEFIKFENILYLQSDGRYTTFFLNSGNSILASKNLGEFENELPKSSFFRIHKSYIVNLSCVQSIDKSNGKSCILPEKISLPIASRRLEDFMRVLQKE